MVPPSLSLFLILPPLPSFSILHHLPFFRFVCVRERNKEGRGKDTGRQGQSWKLSTSNFFRNFLRSLCPLVQFPQTPFYIHVQVPEKFVIRVLLGHVDPRGDFEGLDLGILEDFLGEGGLSEAAHSHDGDNEAPVLFLRGEKQIQNRLLLVIHAHHAEVGVQNHASPSRDILVDVLLPYFFRGGMLDSVPRRALLNFIDLLPEQPNISAEVIAAAQLAGQMNQKIVPVSLYLSLSLLCFSLSHTQIGRKGRWCKMEKEGRVM